jgi:Ubiquitin elongating factor core
MGAKLCIDAHFVGRQTLPGFRSFFNFTNVLFLVMNNSEEYVTRQSSGKLPELFENYETFQTKLIQLPTEEHGSMAPVDLAVLPTCLLQNLTVLPRMFRHMNPEAYSGCKETELALQLATNVSVILNKRVKNPHIRAEMIKFIAFMVPQSFFNRNKKDRPQQDNREDNLYKDVFFTNPTLKSYLIEALVAVYIDSERTGYYEKASFRFYASVIMEFVWSDAQYRERFMHLGSAKPGLFIEFCNFLINDMNNLLFDGLLEIGEIRDYESL